MNSAKHYFVFITLITDYSDSGNYCRCRLIIQYYLPVKDSCTENDPFFNKLKIGYSRITEFGDPNMHSILQPG